MSLSARAPRLSVLLGSGGVGKTTLAAGYAVAQARRGKRVGLLGIDPTHRLETALGVLLSDAETPLPEVPECQAAVLDPAVCMRRWATSQADHPEALLANPFFRALADELAAAADVIAAVRVVEWAERDTSLTEIVVDTAPGLNAIEFLRRPRHLASFLEGEVVTWLRRYVRGPSGDWLERRTIRALKRVGGGELLLDFAEFLRGIERPVELMLDRIAKARRLIEDAERTQLLLVTTVRDDAVAGAAALAAALRGIGLAPRAVIVNRTIERGVAAELERIALDPLSPPAAMLVRYARSYAKTQTRVLDAARPLAPALAQVPLTMGLHQTNRLDVLAGLGMALEVGLASSS